MKESELLLQTIEKNNLWDKVVEVKRNEFVKVKGSIDTQLYFIEDGSLRIFVIDEYEEHTIRFGYPGNMVVALDSFITGNPSEYYIQALKKTKLKVLSKAKFQELLSSQKEFENVWTIILEQVVLQQLERERDILISSPVQRYERVLKRSPRLFQEIPHKYIAEYLRMTPETLSRIKKS